MANYPIRVENLSKRYKIGRPKKYRMLRDAIIEKFNIASRAHKDKAGPSAIQPENNFIWALRNVSFQVQQGDSLGIIGRNGAGKSTLLKILARVTAPTSGRVRLRGRVGSLLEVGTGFHPELTGRENIYLNGAVLGMRKIEIDRKFDEIVDFSEVENFLDTPVKFFSSGMRVRLAFSVAAHLEPEILLVDEVLAVGDMAFQKKCLGKMEKVAQEGRTVLFVSHNMGTIKAMCKKALFINNGEMAYFGGVDAAIDNYLSTIETRSGSEAQADINPSRSIQILSASIMDMEGKPTSVIGHDEPFTIRIQVAVNKPMYKTAVGLLIHNRDFETILASYDFEQMDDVLLTRQPGHYSFQVHVPATLLVPGNYRISVIINKSDRKKKIIHSLDHVCPFEIFDNGSIYARSNYNWQGVIHIPLQWETEVVFMRD